MLSILSYSEYSDVDHKNETKRWKDRDPIKARVLNSLDSEWGGKFKNEKRRHTRMSFGLCWFLSIYQLKKKEEKKKEERGRGKKMHGQISNYVNAARQSHRVPPWSVSDDRIFTGRGMCRFLEPANQKQFPPLFLSPFRSIHVQR